MLSKWPKQPCFGHRGTHLNTRWQERVMQGRLSPLRRASLGSLRSLQRTLLGREAGSGKVCPTLSLVHSLDLIPSHPWKAPDLQRDGGQENRCKGSKSLWFLFSQEPMTKAGYQAGSCRSQELNIVWDKDHKINQHGFAGKVPPYWLWNTKSFGLPGERQGAGLNGAAEWESWV